MKETKLLLLCLLIVIMLSGCAHNNTSKTDDYQLEQEYRESDAVIEDFKEKYSAVDFNDEDEDIEFSAEVVDMRKEKNIYMELSHINDVFYSDNELFMYAESFLGNEHILLEITPEQYSVIQSLNNEYIGSDIHIIFTLNNVEPMIPNLDASFYLDISSPDDVLDYVDTSVSFNSRIIQGTLIDIIEVTR